MTLLYELRILFIDINSKFFLSIPISFPKFIRFLKISSIEIVKINLAYSLDFIASFANKIKLSKVILSLCFLNNLSRFFFLFLLTINLFLKDFFLF